MIAKAHSSPREQAEKGQSPLCSSFLLGEHVPPLSALLSSQPTRSRGRRAVVFSGCIAVEKGQQRLTLPPQRNGSFLLLPLMSI